MACQTSILIFSARNQEGTKTDSVKLALPVSASHRDHLIEWQPDFGKSSAP